MTLGAFAAIMFLLMIVGLVTEIRVVYLAALGLLLVAIVLGVAKSCGRLRWRRKET